MKTLFNTSQLGAYSTLSVNNNLFTNIGIGESFFPTATEAEVDFPFYKEGKLSNLYIYVTINDFDAATTTVRTRVNNNNGNQVISILAGNTGAFSDLSNEDIVESGDELAISMVVPNTGTGNLAYQVLSCFFETNNRFLKRMGFFSLNVASVTRFFSMLGSDPRTSENDAEGFIDKDGTFNNFVIRVNTNSRTTTTVLRFRKNAGNGNLNISVPGSTTGEFSDLSNSDTVSNGDEVNFSIVTSTGTGSINGFYTIEFQSNNYYNLLSGHPDNAAVQNANDTIWHNFFAPKVIFQEESSEDAFQDIMPEDTQVSQLRIRLTANTVDGSSEFCIRKNSQNTILISIPSSTTGNFINSSDSALLKKGDLVNLQMETNGSTGSMTKRTESALLQYKDVDNRRIILASRR